MPTPPIYFIRHGETDWNAEQRYQGQRDIPLNETGKAQARRNGAKLAEILPDPSAYALHCSPLTRTRQTLAFALEAAGWTDSAWAAGALFDPQLIELSFGDWEGWTLSDIKERDPDNYYHREKDKWRHCPPNGESYGDLASRVEPWWARLTGPTVVVAHGGVLRVLRQALEQVPKQEAPLLETPQDRIYCWSGNKASWL